jgi:hypothetical protein
MTRGRQEKAPRRHAQAQTGRHDGLRLWLHHNHRVQVLHRHSAQGPAPTQPSPTQQPRKATPTARAPAHPHHPHPHGSPRHVLPRAQPGNPQVPWFIEHPRQEVRQQSTQRSDHISAQDRINETTPRTHQPPHSPSNVSSPPAKTSIVALLARAGIGRGCTAPVLSFGSGAGQAPRPDLWVWELGLRRRSFLNSRPRLGGVDFSFLFKRLNANARRCILIWVDSMSSSQRGRKFCSALKTSICVAGETRL